jgi:RluA family pseudouridine synthase
VPIIGYGPGWLVVEKPAGMSVHNDPHQDLCAVLSDYLLMDHALAGEFGFDATYGLHAVHRLDKETSGVILLACRREVAQHLASQFSQGQVIKHYLALVHGSVAQPRDEGLWQWPLTPKAAGRRNLQGHDPRFASQTRYRALQYSAHYTLLACQPLTGRTHQIRRHAALAGHPVVGDRRYGSQRACRYVARHDNFTRLALHCHSLRVNPPGSREFLIFESAGFPSEIQKLIDGDSHSG